jgi:hypothetical protein
MESHLCFLLRRQALSNGELQVGWKYVDIQQNELLEISYTWNFL